jgi:mRNA interferase RelE/StbE
MKYQVLIAKPAKKSLDKLQSPTRNQLLKAALALGENPRPHKYTKLTDRDDYRIGVGSYRIVYTIDDPGRMVVVTVVSDRKVYR